MTDKWSDFTREDLCELATSLTDDCEKLSSELAAARADAMSAIKLVTDIRFALGDNGKRMQTELIKWCQTLAADARRIDRIEALAQENNECVISVDTTGRFGLIAYGDSLRDIREDSLREAIDASMPSEEPKP